MVTEGCLAVQRVFGMGNQKAEEGSRALWLLIVTCIAEALNSRQAKRKIHREGALLGHTVSNKINKAHRALIHAIIE